MDSLADKVIGSGDLFCLSLLQILLRCYVFYFFGQMVIFVKCEGIVFLTDGGIDNTN